MGNPHVKLIGLYIVEENLDVTLVELLIDKKANEINLNEFTQEMENETRLNWQAPFDEKYLDISGKTIIGDCVNSPQTSSDITRLTFFIYFLDTAKPLLTPFGKMQLIQRKEAPLRIKNIIFFENAE